LNAFEQDKDGSENEFLKFLLLWCSFSFDEERNFYVWTSLHATWRKLCQNL